MRRGLIYLCITALALMFSVRLSGAEISFSGNSLRVLEETPNRDTGLDRVYVAYNVAGISISFTDVEVKAGGVKWYKYSNLGGGYAEELPGVTVSGTTTTLTSPEGDMGYIIEYGDSRRYYFWLVEYSRHRLELKGISIAEPQPCESTDLLLDYSGDAIHYYSISGRQLTLDQEIKITYTTLIWQEQDKIFNQEETTHTLASARREIQLTPAVLSPTTFLVTGDKFLEQWNWGEEVESEAFTPNAVEVYTEAIQHTNETEVPEGEESIGSNQINGDTTGLGGSAPAEISFYAYVSDGVVHHEWQMTRDINFDTIDYRFNVQDLDYTFMEEGTFYLRYIGSNATGSCEAYSETYTVNIGASEIKCPNAFSPNASPGVNDEWKVAYRSITEFKCWIFNRYGTQLYYYENPAGGWDGKYRGKYVKPGVYYYVIEAHGADGQNYKLSGDINIIGYKQNQGVSSESPTP